MYMYVQYAYGGLLATQNVATLGLLISCVVGRADGRLYDLRDHNGLSDLQVENQLSAGSMYHAENVDREDETWKCVVRMYVASGVVEKTLREAGLPEF